MQQRTVNAGYGAGWVLTAGKSCPGPVMPGCLDFLGGEGACAPRGRDPSWQLEEEEGREKSTGFGGASLAVTCSAEWKETVKATELSTSLPPVLPAGLGKACQACQEKQPCGWSWSEGTCSTHRAQSRKDTSVMRSEQECIVFVPLSVSLCGGSRECTSLTRTRPQPGEGFPRPSGG